jgi:splicing factor 3A subunit 3
MALHTYLLSFTKRTEPLVDISTIQRESEAEFDKLWEGQKVPGWEQTIPVDGAVSGDEIWCSACECLPSM